MSVRFSLKTSRSIAARLAQVYVVSVISALGAGSTDEQKQRIYDSALIEPAALWEIKQLDPKEATEFLLPWIASTHPERSKTGILIMLSIDGWDKILDEKLSVYAERWKKHTPRSYGGLQDPVSEQFAPPMSSEAMKALTDASGLITALGRFPRKECLLILAKHLDTDGRVIWEWDPVFYPMNFHIAYALISLNRKGISFPDAPYIAVGNDDDVRRAWMKWWWENKWKYLPGKPEKSENDLPLPPSDSETTSASTPSVAQSTPRTENAIGLIVASTLLALLAFGLWLGGRKRKG